MSVSITQFNHLRISLDEIQKATNNFSEDNKIGRDDFGYIYEGQLFRSGELINVSARRLDRSQGLGDIEFLTEVSVLSGLDHPSIVSLIGFCDENGEKIIVNSYEAKGGLCMYLDDPSLTWIQRVEIIIGVAKALSYLHNEEGRNYSIIHRNINSSTILLDENNKAKLSGFEYSIKHSTDRMESYIPSEIIDSQGYMAPESIKSGIATEKSDIYSFGVVICELICGRKAFLPDGSEDNKFLAPLFRFHKKRNTLDDIIHPDLRKTMTPFLDELKSFANTASFCIHPQPELRYDIKVILLLLWRLYDSYKKSVLARQQPSKGELGAMVETESTSSGAWKGELGAMVESTSSGVWKANKFEHLRIRLIDIQLATNNFSKESTHMEERFYTVYRGDLECFDRDYVSSLEDKNKVELPKRRYTNVRIKCIKDANAVDRFHTEIEVLSACKHNNILSLLGFCDEGRHMILVHEANHMHDNHSGKEYLAQRLNSIHWLLCVLICGSIAFGLDYIHNEMEVIHCQLSSNAILMDLKHGVKICEFGRSTFLSSNQGVRHLAENFLDPFEFMAPEFRKTGIPTKESDIYSFGLLMFEILSGVPYFYFWLGNPECMQSEHSWFKYGTIKQNVSKKLKEENRGNKLFLKEGPNEDSLDTFIKITERCLAVNPEQRPTLKVIMMEMRKALNLQMNHKDHLRMSFEDIKSATQNFSRAIGVGGFGRVYRGELASEHGYSTIVAKRLDTRGGQGDQQFYNELHILSEYKHENVIGLVGYNNDEQERIIVYEYASKGSLDNYLNDASLTWIIRLNICIDIARGLAFLHGGVREHEAVIHRDMKTANVLLFDDWKAKVADFGLSLIYTKNDETDYVIDNVSGTPGYLDPVYQKSRFLTKESDIYSLGVVLFEILYGKSTYEIKKRENQFLQSLVKQRHEEGRLDEVVFTAIKNQIVPEALATFQAIGYQCLHDDREERPTAQQVLVQLQKALELQDSFKKSFLARLQPSKGELGAMVESTSSGAWKANKFEHLRIPFKDIQLATNYFSKESTHKKHKSYTVYRGDLECFDRDYVSSLEDKNKVELPKRRYTNVRIKRIKDANAVDRFHTEIEVLSACKHDNILSLLGFCDEGRHMILVHEASGKEYLEQRLNFFGWLLRVSICRLIALGLDYIHNEMEVIHRQLSSKAILIDLEHGVKICEFGLSTFLSSNQDEDTRHLGENLFDPYAQDYMAPEFRETGIATKESDIYSFGLLMFEILTGVRYPTFCINNPECKQSEHSWFKYGTIKQNVSKRLKEENRGNKLFLKEGPNEDSLDTFIKITERCLAVNPEQRPILPVIIMELGKALEFQVNHKDHLRMSFKDIESATQNFSRANEIGGGGFGRVYRGVLASEHGSSTIVAKRLDTRGGQGDQQFKNELRILSEYKHENVIGLVGYNNDEQERIVVYEYASKGSLDSYLNDASLTWIIRLNICIDIARGLAFLHAGVREHEAVIHRDLKSANILLFDDWKAKVADFGLSLIYTKNDQTDYVIDYASGTPGYLDPVYQKSRVLTKESDIYSLGVILFEILYGKSTYEIKKRENQFLQSLVKQRHEEGRLDEVVFTAIKNQIVPEALATFQAIGYQCLHDDREQRPTAQQVLVQLQKALELQVKGVPCLQEFLKMLINLLCAKLSR